MEAIGINSVYIERESSFADAAIKAALADTIQGAERWTVNASAEVIHDDGSEAVVRVQDGGDRELYFIHATDTTIKVG